MASVVSTILAFDTVATRWRADTMIGFLNHAVIPGVELVGAGKGTGKMKDRGAGRAKTRDNKDNSVVLEPRGQF